MIRQVRSTVTILDPLLKCSQLPLFAFLCAYNILQLTSGGFDSTAQAAQEQSNCCKAAFEGCPTNNGKCKIKNVLRKCTTQQILQSQCIDATDPDTPCSSFSGNTTWVEATCIVLDPSDNSKWCYTGPDTKQKHNYTQACTPGQFDAVNGSCPCSCVQSIGTVNMGDQTIQICVNGAGSANCP